jgi:hypothetical protein
LAAALTAIRLGNSKSADIAAAAPGLAVIVRRLYKNAEIAVRRVKTLAIIAIARYIL